MNSTKRIKNTELAKKMTPELRQLAAQLTNKSLRYVNSVLNTTDTRYSQDVIDVCELLVAEKEAAFQKLIIKVRQKRVEALK